MLGQEVGQVISQKETEGNLIKMSNKIAFICELPKEHFPFWNDGLAAALQYLVDTYNWQIDIYNLPSMTNPTIPADYEFALFWGALAKKQHEQRFFKKQGLCFGGGPTYHPNINNFDIIFAESRTDLEEFQRMGIKTLQAFGTNTKLFRPIPTQEKVWDFIYPAAFAKWKHHEVFVEQTKGKKALAVGYIQPGGWEKECYEICLKHGVTVIPWVPYEAMPWLYNASKMCLITADEMGGCQRTILEAKACGIPVSVVSDSPKLSELIDLTRKEILTDWNEETYAEQLRKGIEEVTGWKSQKLEKS